MKGANLVFENVYKRFGGRSLLEGLSLRVNPGDVLVVQGPSGAGKTTVLELAAGFLDPDQGAVRSNATRMGYAMQDDCLIPWCSARENVLFSVPAGENTSIDRAMADSLRIEGILDSMPVNLSGGERRRIVLARSLIVRPDLLLLDEPLAFQDEEASRAIVEILRAVNGEGTTLVIATHDEISAGTFGSVQQLRLSIS